MASNLYPTLASCLLFSLTAHWSQAECPCEPNTAVSHYEQAMPAPMNPLSRPIGPMPRGRDRQTASPPPGTLGRTYFLPSRDIPADKHPRIAMLDVVAPEATSVRVENVYVHREEDLVDGFEDPRLNGLWRFETDPLIPGNPHIFKVVFRKSEAPRAPEDVRYVRLIPGRILELTY